MKMNAFVLLTFIIFASCSAKYNSTSLTIGHKEIQTFGFDNPGNMYVIKYKSISDEAILKNLLKKYKTNKPKLLKHINGISMIIEDNDLKKVVEDFLQAGEIEYIERTPLKTLY